MLYDNKGSKDIKSDEKQGVIIMDLGTFAAIGLICITITVISVSICNTIENIHKGGK